MPRFSSGRCWTFACVLALAGCHAYQPAALETRRVEAEWALRRLDDPGVGAFAARLGAATPRSPVFDPADGLTLPEAEAVAMMFNPELRIARRRAGVTQARSKHAGLWSDPVLNVDAERILSSVQNPWVLTGTIGLTIPISGRLEAEKRQASAEHAVELIRVAAAESATRSRLRDTWAQWSAQSMKVQLLDKLIEQLGALGQVTGKLVQAGAITRVEGRLLQIERASRQAEHGAATLRAEELRLQLHAMMGLIPDAPVQLLPELEIPYVPDKADAELSSAPAILTARAEYETAERVLEREVRTQFPDITIGPGGGTDEGDRRLLLGLSLPIPLWNRNVQAVREAWAARELAGEQLRVAVETQTFALRQARLQIEGARKQRAILESTIVPTADEQAAEVRKVADLGEMDAMLLLDAVRRQYEAKLRLLETRVEEIQAAARLEELLGTEMTTAPRGPNLPREKP